MVFSSYWKQGSIKDISVCSAKCPGIQNHHLHVQIQLIRFPFGL